MFIIVCDADEANVYDILASYCPVYCVVRIN